MSVWPGGVLVRKKDFFLLFFTIKLLSRLDHVPEGQGEKGREGADRSAGGEQASEGDWKADPLLGCSRGDPPPVLGVSLLQGAFSVLPGDRWAKV